MQAREESVCRREFESADKIQYQTTTGDDRKVGICLARACVCLRALTRACARVCARVLVCPTPVIHLLICVAQIVGMHFVITYFHDNALALKTVIHVCVCVYMHVCICVCMPVVYVCMYVCARTCISIIISVTLPNGVWRRSRILLGSLSAMLMSVMIDDPGSVDP